MTSRNSAGLSRRGFVSGAAALFTAACAGGAFDEATGRRADVRHDPFTLGVASGDPTATSVILWTRLALERGLEAEDTEVAWVVARDRDLLDVVASGTAIAPADAAHSVHVDATGLEPDRWYHYAFSARGWTSEVGRTRTFPAPGQPSPGLRFGFSSCQNWEDGRYAAHRHASEDDLDLFIWLGDYIYEGRGSVGVRDHDLDDAVTLDGYRQRYALHRSDPALQANHAARPWLVTWDDHEVENDYAGDISVVGGSVEAFRERRAAAYQAWYEHMPVRVQPPDYADMVIHRDLVWGDLAHVFMLDTRQFRADQPTDGESFDLPGFGESETVGVRSVGPTALDPDHSMLGPEQERWLVEAMGDSDEIWNVLAQSVVMHGLDLGNQMSILDGWDGYTGNRKRLLEDLSATDATNLVVLSGDLHAATAGEVRTDPFDRSSPVVATEFAAAAISSAFGSRADRLVRDLLADNPQIKFFDPRNGYGVCDVTRESWTTTFRAVADISDDRSTVEDIARLVVVAGAPGVEPD